MDILKIISKSRYILLLTHKNPDIDTISSALAFSLYLDNIGKKYKLFNIESIPKNSRFLPNSKKITNILPSSFDLAIFFDTANIDRIGAKLNLDNVKTICFDHHISNNNFANINIVDISSPSTAQVLAEFFLKNSIKIDKKMATTLLAGIYDDSKMFTIDRVNKKSFEIVIKLFDNKIDISSIINNLYKKNSLSKYRLKIKVLNSLELLNEGSVGIIRVEPNWIDECGANLEDADEFVDEVLNLAIVEIAILLRMKNDKIRVSFRSKTVNVSKIANRLDGGGHKLAAGATIDTQNFDEAIVKIKSILDKIGANQN